jgi:hypothetical protein
MQLKTGVPSLRDALTTSKLDEFHHKLRNSIDFGNKHNRRTNMNSETRGNPT